MSVSIQRRGIAYPCVPERERDQGNLLKREALGNGGLGRGVRSGLVLLREGDRVRMPNLTLGLQGSVQGLFR